MKNQAHAAASNEDMAMAQRVDRMGNRSLYTVRALGRRARGGKGACVCVCVCVCVIVRVLCVCER